MTLSGGFHAYLRVDVDEVFQMKLCRSRSSLRRAKERRRRIGGDSWSAPRRWRPAVCTADTVVGGELVLYGDLAGRRPVRGAEDVAAAIR
jgi:hypothetical protein